MNDRDRYVESLVADLYWAGEQWFRKIDPYHGLRPRWFALREDLKEPYREMAKQMIERDTAVSA